MQNFIITLAYIDIVGVAVFVFALLSAPYGFEDEKGFHVVGASPSP